MRGEDELLTVFKRTPTSEIRVTKRKAYGSTTADLRLFVRKDNGSWTPTSKGLSLSTVEIEDLISALQKLQREAVIEAGGYAK